MAVSKSLEMPPITESWLRIFFKSQLCFSRPKLPQGLDLSGKTAVMVGANGGLGISASLQLLDLGLSQLVVAVRSHKSGDETVAKLREKFPHATYKVLIVEMTSYSSIQEFVKQLDSEIDRIDYVFLSAGIIRLEFRVVPETGHEEDVQVNYLSTFLLAILLLPLLKTKGHRTGTVPALSIVNSGTSLFPSFPNRAQVPLLASFDDTSIQPWDPTERYWSSKLIGMLFFTRLVNYLNPKDVIVQLIDPGYSRTGLDREAKGIQRRVLDILLMLLGRPNDVAASAYIDAAVVKGEEAHGCFVMDWEIRPFAKVAYEPEMQPVIERLWNETLDEFEFARARNILDAMKSS